MFLHFCNNYLVFGKIVAQIFYTLGKFSLFKMAKYSKDNIAIWSQVTLQASKGCKRMHKGLVEREANLWVLDFGIHQMVFLLALPHN